MSEVEIGSANWEESLSIVNLQIKDLRTKLDAWGGIRNPIIQQIDVLQRKLVSRYDVLEDVPVANVTADKQKVYFQSLKDCLNGVQLGLKIMRQLSESGFSDEQEKMVLNTINQQIGIFL